MFDPFDPDFPSSNENPIPPEKLRPLAKEIGPLIRKFNARGFVQEGIREQSDHLVSEDTRSKLEESEQNMRINAHARWILFEADLRDRMTPQRGHDWVFTHHILHELQQDGEIKTIHVDGWFPHPLPLCCPPAQAIWSCRLPDDRGLTGPERCFLLGAIHDNQPGVVRLDPWPKCTERNRKTWPPQARKYRDLVSTVGMIPEHQLEALWGVLDDFRADLERLKEQPADVEPQIQPRTTAAGGGKGKEEVTTDSPPKKLQAPRRKIKAPLPLYHEIYTLHMLFPGLTQQKLAELAQKQFREPVTQPKVHKALKYVKAYLKAGNILPDLDNNEQVSTISVDPSQLEKGRRTDGRPERQSSKNR